MREGLIRFECAAVLVSGLATQSWSAPLETPAEGFEPLATLATTRQVWFDMAMLEQATGIERILGTVPADRIVFGSHAPFFIHESAVLKLLESELPQAVRGAITRHNAVACLTTSGP
jgi:hypothetical protein